MKDVGELRWHKHLLSGFLAILSMLLPFGAVAEENLQASYDFHIIDRDIFEGEFTQGVEGFVVYGDRGTCNFDTMLMTTSNKYQKDDFEYQSFIFQDYCEDDKSRMISGTLVLKRNIKGYYGYREIGHGRHLDTGLRTAYERVSPPWQIYEGSFTLQEKIGKRKRTHKELLDLQKQLTKTGARHIPGLLSNLGDVVVWKLVQKSTIELNR